MTKIEMLIKSEGKKLLCSLLQSHIDASGEGDAGISVIGSDGIERNHKRIGSREVKTIFGKIKVRRMGYSARGETSLFPKDAKLNLPKNSYSFNLQKFIVLEIVKSSFESAIETIERLLEIKIPKLQAEKIASESAIDFDKFYEQKKKTKEETHNKSGLLILTIDGKGIVMKKDSLREQTKKRAERKESVLKKKLSPGEKKNSKRMAAVASVYLADKFTRKPEDVVAEIFHENKKKVSRPRATKKRVWASLDKSFEEITGEMFEEALKKDTEQKKDWVALVDGDKKQIKYLKKQAKKHKINITIICDFIHALEYLWAASNNFSKESKEREKWVKKYLMNLLEGKASLVAAGIRRSATRRDIKPDKRKSTDKCATYLLNLSPYFKYNKYLQHGYPIATGVIEGACRHLVQDRMGITGARWSLNGAEAILKLRSLKVSGEFDNYWTFHEGQEFIRNYEEKYADLKITGELNKNLSL